MDPLWSQGTRGTILHDRLAWLVAALDWISTAIDLVAILLLLLGAARFAVGVARSEMLRGGAERVRGTNRERIELGRYILAALELLIVSDIILTSMSLALADLAFLGLLVVIRSLISFYLDRELGELRRELGEGALDAPGARPRSVDPPGGAR